MCGLASSTALGTTVSAVGLLAQPELVSKQPEGRPETTRKEGEQSVSDVRNRTSRRRNEVLTMWTVGSLNMHSSPIVPASQYAEKCQHKDATKDPYQENAISNFACHEILLTLSS